jgi:hypothetical protein
MTLLCACFDCENGSNAFLRNVGELPDYMVSRHRRQHYLQLTAVGTPDLTALWKDLWYRMLPKFKLEIYVIIKRSHLWHEVKWTSAWAVITESRNCLTTSSERLPYWIKIKLIQRWTDFTFWFYFWVVVPCGFWHFVAFCEIHASNAFMSDRPFNSVRLLSSRQQHVPTKRQQNRPHPHGENTRCYPKVPEIWILRVSGYEYIEISLGVSPHSFLESV